MFKVFGAYKRCMYPLMHECTFICQHYTCGMIIYKKEPYCAYNCAICSIFTILLYEYLLFEGMHIIKQGDLITRISVPKTTEILA